MEHRAGATEKKQDAGRSVIQTFIEDNKLFQLPARLDPEIKDRVKTLILDHVDQQFMQREKALWRETLKSFRLSDRAYQTMRANTGRASGNAELLVSIKNAYDSELKNLKRQLYKASNFIFQSAIAQAKTEKESTINPLTKLVRDQRTITQLFKIRVDTARREQQADKVMLWIRLDVNGVKTINDTYGHTRGDELIALVSDVIQQTIRQADRAFNPSGDEFIIMAEVNQGAEKVFLDRITTALDQAQYSVQDARGHYTILKPSVAIGAKILSMDELKKLPNVQTWPDVIPIDAAADQAMYVAKAQSKKNLADALQSAGKKGTLTDTPANHYVIWDSTLPDIATLELESTR